MVLDIPKIYLIANLVVVRLRMNLLLNDEEIEEAITGASYLVGATVGLTHHQKVAKAQLKKGVGYMNGKCSEHWANSTPFRWRCPQCWQALLEEVKE